MCVGQNSQSLTIFYVSIAVPTAPLSCNHLLQIKDASDDGWLQIFARQRRQRSRTCVLLNSLEGKRRRRRQGDEGRSRIRRNWSQSQWCHPRLAPDRINCLPGRQGRSRKAVVRPELHPAQQAQESDDRAPRRSCPEVSRRNQKSLDCWLVF